MRQKSDLRAFQQRLVTRFYEHAATGAVVPMGGGKTAAALTAARELLDDGVIRAGIVLAPKRVAQLVWPKEIRLWEHLQNTKVAYVSGTAAQREAVMNRPAELYVVGVDNTQWLVEYLKAHSDHPAFDLLIIDELSRFKSPTGKRARALAGIVRRFKNRIGLTGTPRPNGYLDLFRPLQLLSAGVIWGNNFYRWRDERFMALDFHGHRWTIRPEWRDRTLADLRPYWVTISADEMPDLPELVLVRHDIELPPPAAVEYARMQKALIAKFPDRTVLAANAAVAAGKLCQLAQGFSYGEGGPGDTIHVHTEKADQLVELVEDLDGDPVLIAYEFQEDLRVLRDLYPDAPWLGAGVSDKRAEEIEEQWNRGELPILFLHPASAGHGLNLQHGGSQMIWYALPWSAELYDQTRKRFHRPGQTRRCFEHFIMAKGTVDEVKYARVVDKMTLQDAFTRFLPVV